MLAELLQKMDPEETLRLMKLAVNISGYTGTSPYAWSQNKVQFEGRTSLRYLAFLAQLLLRLTYQVFLIARWIQFSYYKPNATNEEIGGLQYNTSAYFIPLFLNLCSFFNADQLHLLMNRTLRYQQEDSLGGKK